MAVAGHVNSTQLSESLERLRQHEQPHDVAGALETLVAAAEGVFGVSGAGLMVADADRVLRYVAATDSTAEVLEAAQEEHGTGPCVESLVLDVLVETSDLRTDARWPGLLADYPDVRLGAVLGVPVHVAGVAVGSLNVYRRDPFEWDQSDQEALMAYADLGESVLAGAVHSHQQSRIVEQLESALESRVAVERAVGVIMERHGLDAVDAFDRLRRAARSSRRRVRDLAREILDGGQI